MEQIKEFFNKFIEYFKDIPERYCSIAEITEETPVWQILLGGTRLGIGFRIILILVSLIAFVFVLKKIRKKQLHIDDALFWIISSCSLLLLSIFPQIAYFCTALLGMENPTNFVFLVVIFVILMKLFSLAIDLSVQKQRLNSLVQNLALANEEIRENKKKLSEKEAEKENNKTEKNEENKE